ncbi:MFS transporter [uncultured Albimonas sp.]|uniref:MFS transporter n=1 Tax=uncultured Albimonas sp. TaxID=1331701 RepID=UPI0030EC4BE6|tara:strand:+ start:2147 stop:3493 length:1347 start_codon:yes stop_codon:yes gene_type:complete
MTVPPQPGAAPAARPRPRLYYGWIVVGVAFVTMGVAVTARTGFGLLFPEVIAEFGWNSGVTSGAFSVGFLASTAFLPVVGWMMTRWGPRGAIPVGAAMVALGYVAATQVTTPLELYVAFGLLAVNGSMAMSYISHSMFLPNWFVRNRGLAIGLAFAGVGVASVALLPAMQWLIETEGWRAACLAMAAITAVAIIPLNLAFQRTRPEDMGLLPDGETAPEPGDAPRPVVDAVVDRKWAETDWTLALAIRTSRFWWVAAGYFCGLFIWYAIQVHQTRFLIDQGFGTGVAALALGMVAFFGIAGQIGVGALSDRWGREVGWTVAGVGYVGASVCLLLLDQAPSAALLWTMVVLQGLLGNGVAAIFGAILAEIFQGRRFPSILTAISLVANMGAAAGVWALGLIRDQTGGYAAGFWLCLALSVICILCIWKAAPRKVRLVSRQAARRAAQAV